MCSSQFTSLLIDCSRAKKYIVVFCDFDVDSNFHKNSPAVMSNKGIESILIIERSSQNILPTAGHSRTLKDFLRID